MEQRDGKGVEVNGIRSGQQRISIQSRSCMRMAFDRGRAKRHSEGEGEVVDGERVEG